MTLPKLQTVLRLLIGESETRTMRLNVGQPVPPFTVGCEGSWVVQGPGVASRHLSFAFDGRELKVAAAAFRGTATINGTAIDERWWPVPYPAEIRFGEGLLLVSCEAPAAQTVGLDVAPVAQSAPSEQKQTALDGAGAWREMQAACAAAIKGADAAGPPAVPAASSDFGKLHVSDAPWPIAPARQVALEAPASAERDALIEGPKGVWRSLSPVKKVTFVLLPFALFGALWPDLPDWVARLRGAPTAPPTATTVVASVSRPAPPSPSSATADPAALPIATGPEKVADQQLERSALDAAFEGRFANAADLYDELAASRPDRPVFRDAARILRQKGASVP